MSHRPKCDGKQVLPARTTFACVCAYKRTSHAWPAVLCMCIMDLQCDSIYAQAFFPGLVDLAENVVDEIYKTEFLRKL